MNQYYDEIMNLKEAEEFKEIVKRWNILSENIKAKPIGAPIILPDMLWVGKSGLGKTKMLRLASEYLSQQNNLMEFYGDVKYFEFLLSYCSPKEPFTEIQRLIDEVDNAAGFRNEFKGIICIDINEWLDHFEEKHFVMLMEYLSYNSDNWLIVLTVYSDNEEKLHNLNAFLSMYLRIERITVSMPKTETFLEYAEKKLEAYGLSLAPDGKKVLSATVDKLKVNKYFDGYKSIKMLCQDIVYVTFSNKNVKSTSLKAKDLEAFSCDSEYVSRMITNIERARQIGLIHRED